MTEKGKVIILQVNNEVFGVYGSKIKAATDAIHSLTKHGYKPSLPYSTVLKRLKDGKHYVELNILDENDQECWDVVVKLMVVAMK